MTSEDHGRTHHRLTVAIARVWMAAGRRFKRPYLRAFARWHEKVAGLADRWTGGEAYFEYDRLKHEYVIVAPHMDQDPDQYEVGHTAGKFAVALALNPIILIFIALEVLGALYPVLPGHWAVALLYTLTTLALAFGVVVGIFQAATMSVAYQVKTENRQTAV